MFAKDGYSSMIIAVIVTAIAIGLSTYLPAYWGLLISIPMLVICGIVIYFFRDPDRVTPKGDELLIAPADGKVILIEEVEEKYYIKGKAKQISIFLSPLDVHVNRNPVTGKLEYLKYHPGDYLVAWHEKASELNERADFGVMHNSGVKVFYRQITGALARRIVYHVDEGQMLYAGDRFGMMKFGSRMDILVPPHIEFNVKIGDRTVAGETILGTLKADK